MNRVVEFKEYLAQAGVTYEQFEHNFDILSDRGVSLNTYIATRDNFKVLISAFAWGESKEGMGFWLEASDRIVDMESEV